MKVGFLLSCENFFNFLYFCVVCYAEFLFMSYLNSFKPNKWCRRGIGKCHISFRMLHGNILQEWDFSFNYRITEWLRLAGTSGYHLVQTQVQVGSPRASCPVPCPDVFWISPRMETLPPPWPTCASARLPSMGKSVSWCSEGTSCFSVCTHCLWSCHWAPLRRARPHPLSTLLQVFVYTDAIPVTAPEAKASWGGSND